MGIALGQGFGVDKFNDALLAVLEGNMQQICLHCLSLQFRIETVYHHVNKLVADVADRSCELDVTANLDGSKELNFIDLAHHRHRVGQKFGGTEPTEFVTVPHDQSSEDFSA